MDLQKTAMVQLVSIKFSIRIVFGSKIIIIIICDKLRWLGV